MELEIKVKKHPEFPHKEIRPSSCKNCGHSELYRHGTYSRQVYTENEKICIQVVRFRCKHCRRTMSILPDFVGPYQIVTWDVQQQAFESSDSGQTLERVAESISLPAGPFSVRTISRWKKRWKHALQEMEEALWAWALSHSSSWMFPQGQKFRTLYQSMVWLWNRMQPFRPSIGMFHGLYRLRQSGRLDHSP